MTESGLREGVHRARRITGAAAVLLVLVTLAVGYVFTQGDAAQRRALED